MMLKMMGGAPEQPGAESAHAHHGMDGTADGHSMDGDGHSMSGDGHGTHGDQGHAHPGHES
jgi:hypothetical protein